MARALVLGESDLDEADNEAFRASGLAHLLAVRARIWCSWSRARWRRSWPCSGGITLGERAVGRRPMGAGVGIGIRLGLRRFRRRLGFGHSRGRHALVRARGPRAGAARRTARARSGSRSSALPRRSARRLRPVRFCFRWRPRRSHGLAAPMHRRCVRQGSPPGRRGAAPARARGARGALATTLAATVGCAPLIAFISPALPIGGVSPICWRFRSASSWRSAALSRSHAARFRAVVERGAAVVASGSLLVVRGIARATQQCHMARASGTAPFRVADGARSWFGAPSALFPSARRRGANVGIVLAGLLFSVVGIGPSRAGRPARQASHHGPRRRAGRRSLVDFPDGRAMLVDGGGLVGSPVDTGQAVHLPTLRVRRIDRARRGRSLASASRSFRRLSAILGGVLGRRVLGHGSGRTRRRRSRLRGAARGTSGSRHPGRAPERLCGRPERVRPAKVEVLAPCPRAPLREPQRQLVRHAASVRPARGASRGRRGAGRRGRARPSSAELAPRRFPQSGSPRQRDLLVARVRRSSCAAGGGGHLVRRAQPLRPPAPERPAHAVWCPPAFSEPIAMDRSGGKPTATAIVEAATTRYGRTMASVGYNAAAKDARRAD